MTDRERFVRASEVARHLGLSTSLVRKKTTSHDDGIPHHRLPGGRAILYRITEIDQWLAKGSNHEI